MCTFGVLGLSCETPAALRPPEREKKNENGSERGKKERNFGWSGGKGGPHNPNHATPHELDFHPQIWTTHDTHQHTHQRSNTHTTHTNNTQQPSNNKANQGLFGLAGLTRSGLTRSGPKSGLTRSGPNSVGA